MLSFLKKLCMQEAYLCFVIFLFVLLFLALNWIRKERTMLDPVLSRDVLIMPCKGILKACAMSLPVSYIVFHKKNFLSFAAQKHMHAQFFNMLML